MKILLFIPVKESYTQLWEYYKNDRDILEDISSDIYYSNNFFSFISSILKVDYVYCWWWHTSIFQIIISKLLRKKVICTGALHMFDYGGGDTFFKRNFLYRILHRISFYLADVNLFITNDQKKQIASHIKVNNPRVVYSSLEKNHLKDYFRIKKDKKNNKTTIIASTLWLTKSSIKRKGLFETLDALDLLSNNEFFFYIIGKKDNGYESLIKKIESLKIKEKIRILTDLPTKDKFNILENTDLYLQPSHYEGLGNAVIEAMSRGCVPIVSRFASQPEVVGNIGYIVNEINKNEISYKILEYLNLSVEDKIKLRNNILDFSHDKFSYDNHLKKLKSIFENFN